MTGLVPAVKRSVPIVRELSKVGEWFGHQFELTLEGDDDSSDGGSSPDSEWPLGDEENLKHFEKEIEEADKAGHLYVPAPNGDLIPLTPDLRKAVEGQRQVTDRVSKGEQPSRRLVLKWLKISRQSSITKAREGRTFADIQIHCRHLGK